MRNTLTAAEYWEWRTTISEMHISKLHLEKTSLEYKLLQRDAEILHVRTQLFQRTRMDSAKKSVEESQAEYERYKGVLEKALGQSLNNKIIDDLTFEIKGLPDGTPNEPEVAKELKHGTN